MAASLPAWMAACDLPHAWQGRDAWRVLDTQFADGRRFLALWHAWAQDPNAARMLHVVAIMPQAPDADTFLSALAGFPALGAQATDLRRQWFGLLPGLHRLVLHDARLRLTLCVGAAQKMLRELQFEADSIFLDGFAEPAEPERIRSGSSGDYRIYKTLGRLSRHGTSLAAPAPDGAALAALAQTGFVAPPATSAPPPKPSNAPSGSVSGYRFGPHWPRATTRSPWRRAPASATHCVVVGAGLAGATVALALADRGWQVTVLDRASAPAAGASGLPVGLLAPLVSRDDNPRSRLARAGIRLALQAASRLLQPGRDWAWSGVVQCAQPGRAVLPSCWPRVGEQWSSSTIPAHFATEWRDRIADAEHAIWHTGAGWIKPACLVQACLAQPGVRFVGDSAVHAIDRHDDTWRIRDADGKLLAQAPHLVIACAGDTIGLINQAASVAAGSVQLAPLSGVDGQVSWASHTQQDARLFPPFAINGAGSVIAHVPHQGASAWFAGATYEPQTQPPLDAEAAHAQNRSRFAQLLPAAAAAVAHGFPAGHDSAWRGTRWTTPDRLPLAGAVDAQALPGLWVSAALGSRGLTYSLLCAEVIAALVGAEPLPLEASLLRSISASRRNLRANAGQP